MIDYTDCGGFVPFHKAAAQTDTSILRQATGCGKTKADGAIDVAAQLSAAGRVAWLF